MIYARARRRGLGGFVGVLVGLAVLVTYWRAFLVLLLVIWLLWLMTRLRYYHQYAQARIARHKS